MNNLKCLVIVSILSLSLWSNSARASFIFMSGIDDECVSCTLSTITSTNYVNPTGTDLDGAVWVQDGSVWNKNGSYQILEFGFSNNNQSFSIDSLFVSFDDTLVIRVGEMVIFDSQNFSIEKPWRGVVDIIALIGQFEITPVQNLSFSVSNPAKGPTGVIWKGLGTFETGSTDGPTKLPEPAYLALIGLFILLVSSSKRKPR